MNGRLPNRFLILRTTGFALGGLISGGLSVLLIDGLGLDSLPGLDLLPAHRSSWLPGLVYGVLLLTIVLLRRPLRLQGRSEKGWWWLVLIPMGSATAYYVAFFTAVQIIFYLEGPLWDWGISAFMLGGFAGGIPGSIGLILTLTPALRSLDRTRARIGFVLLGATLGTLLAVISISELPGFLGWFDGETFILCIFYVGWQSGMMIALSLLDASGRSKLIRRAT